MKKLILIAPTQLSIPAVKGGAVETGIQQIIDENEKECKVDITIISYYCEEAYQKSKDYKHTKFVYYNPKKIDEIQRFCAKSINYILKKLKIKKTFNKFFYYTKFIINELKKFDKGTTVLIKNNVNLVIPIKKKTETEIYLQLHNDFLNKNTYKSEEITKKCKAIITNSEYIKQCVLTIKGINAENVFINKNCLDNDNFLEIDEKTIKEKAKEYSIDLSKKNIIFVGRIVPQKGIKELICATQLISKNIDWNLIIVGSKWFGKTTRDKFGKELKEIAKKNINRIKFMGFIAAKEVKFLYKMADVVVVPSIWEEPAGRVVLEAQSVGTPVILSDAGGMKEYTTPNASMIIKRGKDFESDLAKAIENLLINDELRKKMGNEGREFVKKYNSNNYYNEILQILDLKGEDTDGKREL